MIRASSLGAQNVDDRPLRVVAFETSLGWAAMSLCDGVLTALAFGRSTPAAAVEALGLAARAEPVDRPNPHERRLVKRLQAFADGRPDDFLDVKIDTSRLTEFARRVVVNCRKIPPGKTLTYAQLAAKSGSAGAARAVGNVMATNRFPLLVPCHRVVGAGGSLGGYSAPDGLAMKRRLLEREGVQLDK